MIYKRCQCGKAEYWDGGVAVQPCQGCSSCGTTFSSHPDGHRPVAEHEWEPRYNPRTGAPDKRMCRRCYKTERV